MLMEMPPSDDDDDVQGVGEWVVLMMKCGR